MRLLAGADVWCAAAMNQGYPPPGYGYPPPPKKGLGLGTLAGIGAGVAAVALVVLALVGRKEQERQWDAESAIVVTADEMVATYKGNEIAGDQKYKGKKVEITGEVERIDSDVTDEPVVILAAKDSLLGVRVEGLSKAAAAKLTKATQATFICKGAGELVGSPRVDGCSVADAGPSPVVSVSASSSPLASSAADAEPLVKRSKRVTDAKLKKHGLSWKGVPLFPYDILKAYAVNELGADKTFKRPAAFAGAMRSVIRHDNGKVSITLGDDAEKDPRHLLETGLRKVRIVLDSDDGTSLDVAAELKESELVLVVCDEGRGADFQHVTFASCSIWASAGPPAPAASSPAAPAPPAPAPAAPGTHIDL